MNFRPGQQGTEDDHMDLLSATVSFLVANGNTTNDEVRYVFFVAFFVIFNAAEVLKNAKHYDNNGNNSVRALEYFTYEMSAAFCCCFILCFFTTNDTDASGSMCFFSDYVVAGFGSC